MVLLPIIERELSVVLRKYRYLRGRNEVQNMEVRLISELREIVQEPLRDPTDPRLKSGKSTSDSCGDGVWRNSNCTSESPGGPVDILAGQSPCLQLRFDER